MSPPTGNTALPGLDALVGEWTIEASIPSAPAGVVGGTVTFEWLEGGLFLVERWRSDRDDFPNGVSVIGLDDTTGHFTKCYTDSRGVHRVYQMTLDGGVWRQWRDSPGFTQRFTGTFSDDGNTILAAWELGSNQSTLAHDFHLTYTRVR